MVYSYSNPVTYGPQQPLSYDGIPNYPKVQVQEQVAEYRPAAPSSVPAGCAGAVLGAGIGCISGIRKNPYIEGSNVNDKFAVKAYEKNLKNLEEPAQNAYRQGNVILKKLDGVKNVEELKVLFNENPEAAKEVCSALGKTHEEFLNSVSEKNLSKNKRAIAKKLESANETRFQDMKNQILKAWDSKANKFVKPDGMDENLFKAIKKSTYGMKALTILKRTAIGGAIAGALAFVAHKIYTHKKAVPTEQY